MVRVGGIVRLVGVVLRAPTLRGLGRGTRLGLIHRASARSGSVAASAMGVGASAMGVGAVAATGKAVAVAAIAVAAVTPAATAPPT
jgi:hypothetical protein